MKQGTEPDASQRSARPWYPSDVPVSKLAVTRVEAAALLGVHVNSIDRLVRRGVLKPSRALRRPLFSLAELQRFLAQTQ